MLRATRDHVWPHMLRATRPSIIEPVTVWACYACNQIKGNLLPHVWHAFMRDTPHWWTTPAVFERRRDALARFYTFDARPGITAAAIVIAVKLCRRVTPHAYASFLDELAPKIIDHLRSAELTSDDLMRRPNGQPVATVPAAARHAYRIGRMLAARGSSRSGSAPYPHAAPGLPVVLVEDSHNTPHT